MQRKLLLTTNLVTQYLHNTVAVVLGTLLLLQLLFLPLQNNVNAKATVSRSTPTGSSSSKFGGSLLRQPESIVAPLNDTVLFECELNLTPDRVEWRFRPKNLPKNSKKLNDRNSGFIYLNKKNGYDISTEGDTSKLRVNVNQQSVGEYQCIVWFGAAALASLPAKLELANISLNSAKLPKSDFYWNVSPGNTILLRCGGVNSNPAPVWNFYKDNRLVSNLHSQLPSDALVLSSITPTDSGTYTCSAVNSIIMVEIKIPHQITINVEYSTKAAPSFLYNPPTHVTAKIGATIVLECPGVGYPVPKAIWSRPDANIYNNRTQLLNYGLQIQDVRAEDRGDYVCLQDNGFTPQLVHTIRLEVQDKPVILLSPEDTTINEDHSLELECIAEGYPIPSIYWLINGNDTRQDKAIQTDNTKLVIKNIEKRHAGIVQCFARNEVGEIYVNRLLEVIPKQIFGEIDNSSPIDEEFIIHSKKPPSHGKSRKHKNKHKHSNIDKMIPPSQPTATRLSDDKVMVRWSVPEREGLPIQFFKVQYRLLGDGTEQAKRSHWMTTTEDIPSQARMYEVDNLKPDNHYRFRIAAVYSNNDNMLSNVSAKFFLQRGSQLDPIRSHLPAPNLTNVEPISETSVVLHWLLPAKPLTPFDGFYAYYRSASTAAEYSKTTVDGMHKREFQIDDLEPGTMYEFKLQSFTKLAASRFSAIVTAKTLKLSTPAPIEPNTVAKSDHSKKTSSFIMLVIGIVAAGVIVLVVSILVCVKRLKKTSLNEEENENKTHRSYIEAESISYTRTSNGNGLISGLPVHRTVEDRIALRDS